MKLSYKLRKVIKDEELLKEYLNNVVAYVNRYKVANKETHRAEYPDEALMRRIERRMDVSEMAVDDFRRVVAGGFVLEFPEFTQQLIVKAQSWVRSK